MGAHRRTRRLHKLLRTADLRPSIRSMSRRGRQVYSMVDTQLCVPSKAIERKIHQIRKAEDKVRKNFLSHLLNYGEGSWVSDIRR